MRAFFSCSFLALTATATSKVQRKIKERLHFRIKQKTIAELPLMTNITFKISRKEFFESHLDTILQELKSLKIAAPRRIIFCGRQLDAGELFGYFQEMGLSQFVRFEENNVRMFAMYHKDTPESIKKEILTQLALPPEISPLRYVFATVDLGLV
eukprot:Pompholyxophrys_punicea_v1_NODE_729_length_1390_cov_1.934082.p1 type:complete len:154 gc:universal NODE_729_length_1390_cov_1.934082:534-995(+)